MMRGLLLAIAVVATGCPSVRNLPPGTRVPMQTLHEHRSDLNGYVRTLLDARKYKRAFYALELQKTRVYSTQKLAAAGGELGRSVAELYRDLRPLFRSVFAAAATGDSRGLTIVSDEGRQFRELGAGRDQAFWEHMYMFERRTEPLAKNAIGGIPYSFAARHGYGVSTAEEVSRLMSPDEVFLSYFVHRDAVFAFQIFRGKLRVVRLPESAAAIQAASRNLVELTRTPDTGEAWIAQAKTLRGMVLGPFAATVARKDVRAVFVSPHGFLANVPFALLADDRGRPLIEHLSLSYVPSASIYRQLLSRPILNDPPRMLAVGNAIYPEGLAPLEFAEREAQVVSELFPDGALLTGAGATEGRIRAAVPRYNILHFATHGVLLGRVVPDASSLLVTADDAHDGFLSAAEIAAIDMSGIYIAVLSACETSVTDASSGSIDLGSITNAFLSAGVPSVIGTMWQVDDEATTVLMLEFYQRFLEVGAGEALRQAQLRVRKDARFAHPYFWAAFALYGWDK